MARFITFFLMSLHLFCVEAQSAYWGISFSLSDQKYAINYANYYQYEAAFRQGSDAQDNGFAGIPIHFDIESKRFIYSDEGGVSTDKMLLQIHKIATNEVMSIFFQLEPKCEGVLCMINFPNISFQAGTFSIEKDDIQYNPITINPKNEWELAEISESGTGVVPKAITEIPYYANPEAYTKAKEDIPFAKTEPISQSQPLTRKTINPMGKQVELSAQKAKNSNSFYIKCTTPYRLEKPIATIFDFNTDYNQIIIEFKEIPHTGETVSPLSKEIPIPNIPKKTYNLIVLYNGVRSVGKLTYTGSSLEINMEGSQNIMVIETKAGN